ncbi:hypothetical protein Zmor_022312 [Zophobas morio]|uniref:Serpin domain-containing protein n=3 Tax=Zophobas morio TaxID=2755281 RepID=A0AA38HXG0_9CUCU|nr:hypothetical protein Zmor_022312 [Zophobas morio]
MKTLLLLSFYFLLGAASLEDFSSGNHLFTADLYNELLEEDGNFVASPLSLETVLALTQSGGKDATSAEIRSTLHLPDSEEETESTMKSVLPLLQSENYTLKAANKIYIQENYSIKEEFKKIAADVYQADIQNVNFVENEEAAAAINQWVEAQTQNKIHDLVAADDLDANSRLFLVNALYFQATWLHSFQVAYTAKKDFYSSGDKTVSTDTMLQYSVERKFYQNEELDAKFLEVPFVDEDASMTFVLPNKIDGLAVLEKQRDKVLADQPYSVKLVDVALPKFRIETSIDFNEVLQKMGIRAAFSPGQADFSGISGEKGELYLQKVKQKSFIGVDENGVEAAAASSADVPIYSIAMDKFVADHPFMFYIKVKGVVLFEGRVVDPQY